jgi:exo-beta-1,3-glucanase (GH17 family)
MSYTNHNMQQIRPLSGSSQFRDHPDVNPDLNNFYDPTSLPAPHRLTGHDSPYPSSLNVHDPFASPRNSFSQPSSYQPQDAARRGPYAPVGTTAPVAAAAAATAAGTYAMGNAGEGAVNAHERRGWEHIDNEDAYYNRFPTHPPPKSGKRKWLIIGGIVALVAIIAIGAGVGVSLSKKNTSSGTSSSKSGSTTKQTDPNDPSSFVKDPKLKQSFWGLAYTPEGSQLPNCGNNLTSVIQDMQLISQITTRIRLYGADCNQSALVLEAIKQTKVNMTVWLGDYTIPTDNHAAYIRQRDVIVDALKTYGADHVGGVTVGNEFMLNYLSSYAPGGSSDSPNGPTGAQGAAMLLQDIADMRTTLAGLSLSKTLQVGNAEAGSYFNTQVMAAIDYGMSNVHPWFADTPIDQAAGWTADFFAQTNVAAAQALPNNPTMWIAETGWPTATSNSSILATRPPNSDPSVANLQTFMDTFVCQANKNGTGYFFFEYADEPWKDVQFGGVEGWWGLFNHDRTLKKGLTIPSC